MNPNRRYNIEESNSSISEQDENFNKLNQDSRQNQEESSKNKLSSIKKQHRSKQPSAVQIDLVDDKIKNEENDLNQRVNFEMKRKSCGPGVVNTQEQSKAAYQQKQLKSPSTNGSGSMQES